MLADQKITNQRTDPVKLNRLVLSLISLACFSHFQDDLDRNWSLWEANPVKLDKQHILLLVLILGVMALLLVSNFLYIGKFFSVNKVSTLVVNPAALLLVSPDDKTLILV